MDFVVVVEEAWCGIHVRLQCMNISSVQLWWRHPAVGEFKCAGSQWVNSPHGEFMGVEHHCRHCLASLFPENFQLPQMDE